MEDIVPRVLPAYYTNRSVGFTNLEQLPWGFDLERKGNAKPRVLGTNEKSQVNSLLQFQISWIRDNLGIDVEQRLLHRWNVSTVEEGVGRNLQFYSTEEYKHIQEAYKLPKSSLGVTHSPSGNIDVGGQEDWICQLATTSHEFLHAIQGIGVRTRRETMHEEKIISTGYLVSGYENPKTRAFGDFKELLTEMMSIEMLTDYRDRKGIDYVNKGNTIGYHSGVVFLDMLFAKAAEKLKMDSRTLRLEIYRGCLENDFRPLKLLTQAFGKEAMKTLAFISGEELNKTTTRWIDLVLTFDIKFSSFYSKVGMHEDGNTITLFEGVQI